jgi:hypothetical protein
VIDGSAMACHAGLDETTVFDTKDLTWEQRCVLALLAICRERERDEDFWDTTSVSLKDLLTDAPFFGPTSHGLHSGGLRVR